MPTPTTPQFSLDDLAGQIKAKYPDYASIPNPELVSRVIGKHPVYQTYLNDDALKGLANPQQASDKTSTWQEAKNLGAGLLEAGKQLIDPRVPLVEGKNSILQSQLTGPLNAEQEKANALYAKGGAANNLEATGHQVASYLPFLGPLASRAGELIGRGQYGAGAVDSAMALLGGRGMAEAVKPEARGPVPLGPDPIIPRPGSYPAVPGSKPSASPFAGEITSPEGVMPKPSPVPAVKAGDLSGATPPAGPIPLPADLKPPETAPTPANPIPGGIGKSFSQVQKLAGDIQKAAPETPRPDAMRQAIEQLNAPKPSPIPTYIKEQRGNWFSPDQAVAKRFGKRQVAVDVPVDVAKLTTTSSAPMRAENVLPEAWAKKAQPVENMGPSPEGTVRLFRGTSDPPTQPTKNFQLEDTIRQAIKAPSDTRNKVVLAKTSEAAQLPRDQALALADSQRAQAERANEQAKVIRSVLDRQGDVQSVRERLGAWATQRTVEINPDTGLPVKGSQDVKFENPISAGERDLYNQLLGRKFAEVKARDPETGKRVKPPKTNSPEEAGQVDEFVQRLTSRRDAIVSQVKAGFPTSPETLQEAHELNDQITQLTGMRAKYPTGIVGVKGVAGKAEPVVNERGVWGPDPKAPLPELSQKLYARLMGRDPQSAQGRMRIKPELLEQRIGELNAEAQLRAQVASTLRQQHGVEPTEQTPLGQVPQKDAPVTPKSNRPTTKQWVKDDAGKWSKVDIAPESTRPAAARAGEQAGELQANISTAKELVTNPPAEAEPTLPPRPPDEPGYFQGKVLDPATGKQIGWKKIKVEGPGTPGAAQGPDSSENVMQQLSEALRAQAELNGKQGLLERIKTANDLGDALASGKSAVFDALTKIKTQAAALQNVLTRPEQWSDFKENTGRWSAALQMIAKSRLDFRESMEMAHPAKLVREGISNWVSAGGDNELLERWRDASLGKTRKGYQAALDLDENAKTTARNLQSAHDALWMQLHDAGMIEAYVENYMKGIWKSDQAGRSASSVLGAYRTDSLRPNLGAARQKFYANYFEGEQAGKTPFDKDAGFLFDRSWSEAQQAMASRAYIRGLHEGVADDGQPILLNGGMGTQMQGADAEHSAYLINARSKPKTAISSDGRPYQFYDHPALKKFIYATSDEEGRPIFVKGDALIHPDLYKSIKNQLAPSFVRESAAGRAALNAMGTAKQFMLSLSAFHQAQMDPHGMLGHLVNPTTLKKVNLEDPITSIGLDHGLQLYDPSGHMDWSEGLASGGLVNQIPGIGPLQLKYNNWFWNKHMPELKAAAFEHIYRENQARYGNDAAYNFDKIALKSSNEANASFGGLNMKMLARSAGVEDMFRILALAPDFLEARVRFTGQAIKQGGMTQAAALARLTTGYYMMYRVTNMLANNGDPKWDKPFSTVIGNKEYQMRSLPGDIYHLVNDPYSFVQGRVNPFTVKPGLEMATRRDDLGRRVDLADQAEDLASQFAPFSVQKYLGNKGEDSTGILDSALESIGVSSKAYRGPGLTEARKLYFDSQGLAARGTGNRALRDIEDAASRQSPNLNKIASDALAKGLVTTEQVDEAMDNADKPELGRMATHLNIEQLAQVWKKATPQEKQELIPVITKKADQLDDKPLAEQVKYGKLLDSEFK